MSRVLFLGLVAFACAGAVRAAGVGSKPEDRDSRSVGPESQLVAGDDSSVKNEESRFDGGARSTGPDSKWVASEESGFDRGSRSVGSGSEFKSRDSRLVSPVAGYLADARLLYKVYEECSADRLSACLKRKLVLALDRAVRTDQLEVVDGVRFVAAPRERGPPPGAEGTGAGAALPRGADAESALDQIIYDKVVEFFTTRTLELRLFTGGDKVEGRARRRVLNSLLMLPVLIGGTFVPLAFGALALLAGKALIIAKLALALAAIVGLRKLVGGGGGESYQVVSVPHHGGGHYKRSFEQDDAANHLAYHAHLSNLQGIR